MSKFVSPTYYAERVFDADYGLLFGQGARLLVWDVDNTLMTYGESVPSGEVCCLMDRLSRMGFTMVIVSNGHSERVRSVAKELGMFFVGDALKPAKRGYRTVLKQTGFTPEQTVCVGDQLFTDVWGANRVGAVSVLVRPLDLRDEPGFVKLKRIAEKLFSRRIRKAKRFS